MKFVVEGTVCKNGVERAFTKEIETQSEKLARERIYTHFGATQGIKRTQVKIRSVSKQ